MVLLLVNVRSGLVEQACVVEGDEAFTSSAKDAGLRVKFKPYSNYIQKNHSYAEEIVTYNFMTQSELVILDVSFRIFRHLFFLPVQEVIWYLTAFRR